jgi:multimeric flavodoxin WrbA
MRVIAINSSPRKDGNTAYLLDNALEGASSMGAETRRIDLADMPVRYVNDGDYELCRGDIREDNSDGIGFLVKEIEPCDRLILASPVFFGSVPGKLKSMIDRFQFAWLEKNVNGREVFPERKKGAFICVQAQHRPDFFANASAVVRHFFATVNISYEAELFCGQLEQKNDALKNEAYREKAFQLGKQLVK